jgi:hypothetical protein
MGYQRGTQLDLLSVLEAAAAHDAIRSPPAAGAVARTAWANAVRRAYQRPLGAVLHDLPTLPWEIDGCAVGRSFEEDPTPTDACVGTLMSVNVCPWGHDEAGPRAILYRAACLGCDYEGGALANENAATEEACDHAWPRWRELPVHHAPTTSQGLASYAARVADVMPNWLESGAPLPTLRGGTRGTRSTWKAELGRYDVCVGLIAHPPIRQSPVDMSSGI